MVCNSVSKLFYSLLLFRVIFLCIFAFFVVGLLTFYPFFLSFGQICYGFSFDIPVFVDLLAFEIVHDCFFSSFLSTYNFLDFCCHFFGIFGIWGLNKMFFLFLSLCLSLRNYFYFGFIIRLLSFSPSILFVV